MPRPTRKPDAEYTNIKITDIASYILEDTQYAIIDECGEFMGAKRVNIKVWLEENV